MLTILYYYVHLLLVCRLFWISVTKQHLFQYHYYYYYYYYY